MVNFGPISNRDWFTSLGHPSKFQRVSRVGFVTVPATLNGGQPNLHYVWPSPGLVHYIYIFGGCYPLKEFRQVQNSLCVQVLRYLILAALLRGTRAVGVSQTAAWYLHTTGGHGHPVRHWAVELSSYSYMHVFTTLEEHNI